MEQGLLNNRNEKQLSSLISNIDSVTPNTGYILTTDENNNVALIEQDESISGLSDVQNGLRYHIMRDRGNLTTSEDSSVQIERPRTFNLIYGVRSEGNQFTLTRTPALTDYIFEAEELTFFATFNVFNTRSSRAVHVCNTSGKIVKLGLLHVDLSSYEGLINREYRFNVIINDENQQLIAINPNNSVGSSLSRTLDVENFNIFVNAGDFLGIRYQRDGGGNEGNYCQVRVTVDTNARQSNFGEREIP